MGLDLEAERTLLAGSLQTTIGHLQPDLRDAAGRLPKRFGTFASAATLSDCFSDLTLLYPLLIGEALLPASLQEARDVLVPHALLVLYSQLDDRGRDGQIAIEPVETRLADWMLSEARRQLNQAIGPGKSDAFEVLLPIYAEAQVRRAADPDQLTDLVVRRHLPGLVSTMSVIEANRCEPTRIDRVSAGYRRLVLSLQWIDDLRDLEDDLATGADNLLLCRLPKQIRRQAILPEVITCLHAMGLFSIALEEALAHVEAACEIASMLGCHTLAGLLGRRLRWIAECDFQPGVGALSPAAIGAEGRDPDSEDRRGVRQSCARSPDL